MKIQILCFSPTGNTLYLANILKQNLKCELLNINNEINCDHLIIMSSIHAFRIPKIFKKKLTNIKKLSIIAVGCNTSSINDAAGYHIIKYAKKNNIDIGIYKILAMPLTIVKKFNKNHGAQIVKESISEINKIALDISNNTKIKISFKSKLLSNIHYIESLFVKLFGLELKANKNCIKCGLCAKKCPKNNIKIKNKVKFGLNCMLCMSCIYNCPKKAIHPRFSKFIEFKDGYDLNEYL